LVAENVSVVSRVAGVLLDAVCVLSDTEERALQELSRTLQVDWACLRLELTFLRASAVDLAAVTALGEGSICDELRKKIHDRCHRLVGKSGGDSEEEIGERIAQYGRIVKDPQKTSGSLRDAVGFVFAQRCTDGGSNVDLAHLGGAMFAAFYEEVHQLLDEIDFELLIEDLV